MTKRCKLLCPECREVKKVVEVSELARLECGHSRQLTTLPLTPGRISFEHCAARRQCAAVHKLFPAFLSYELPSDSERTDEIVQHEVIPCVEAFKEFKDGISD